MKSNKAQQAFPGIRPLLIGILTIAIVIILIIGMAVFTDVGSNVYAKIKDISAYIIVNPRQISNIKNHYEMPILLQSGRQGD